MADTKKVITSVLKVSGLLLSDDATLFANERGQLIQVPISSQNINTAASVETADDEDVDALLDALDMPDVVTP